MKAKVFALLCLFAVSAPAQEAATATIPVPPPTTVPQVDLRIIKTYRPPTPAAPGAFVLTVTNYGPGTAPNFQLSDPLPPGLQVVTPFITISPWTCTPTLVCTYGAPLAAGNSAILAIPINVISATTNVVNCATVSLGQGAQDFFLDNNRDCACVDVNPCRDVTIDITTGQQNGVTVTLGSNDTEWLLGNSGNTPSPTTFSTSWVTPTPPPGRWITSPAAGTGTIPFRFVFTLGNEWTTGQCRILMQGFRADNCVTFQVDGNPVFAQTPSANCNSSAAWTVAGTANYVIPNPAGTHTLTANLTNNSGIRGLYVQGSIVCRCKQWDVGEPEPVPITK